jgi:arylsulfatase A-like enzyme
MSGGALLAANAQRPNIVLILADDVGYGDLSCYGARRVRTPNLDRLAAQGVRFTDAHSPSATCTPTRYALLTGEYAWRRKGTGVLPGSASLIIDPARTTVPSLLKASGYKTAGVGKWHLGLGSGEVNWNVEIKPGAREVGFDYSFLIPATGDRVPCVYVENGRVVGLDPADPIQVSYGKPIGNEPTGRERPDLLKQKFSHGHDQTIVNGVSRIGYMTGGKAARWVDEDMADVIARKAVSFLESNRANPFFLYFSTHDIHVPRVPHARFRGKSECGLRCDAMVQLDWCAGEIMRTLDRLNLARNTLVLFTSDNGPVVDDGYADGAVEALGGHKPSGEWRGGKYSNFEGGTRVPFIVRWPGTIQPGVSSALVSHVDFLSSFASLSRQKLPPDAGPDSFDVLPALLGKSQRGRDHLVEHARATSLRQGRWKFIPASPGPRINQNTNTELGTGDGPQLYDLARDPGERNNLAAQNPEKAAELAALLEQIRASGRSRM